MNIVFRVGGRTFHALCWHTLLDIISCDLIRVNVCIFERFFGYFYTLAISCDLIRVNVWVFEIFFGYFYTLAISCDLIRVNVWMFKIYLKIQ